MICSVKNCVTRMHMECAQKAIGCKWDIDNTTPTLATGLMFRNVEYCLCIDNLFVSYRQAAEV